MVKEDRSGWVAVAPEHTRKEDDLPKVTPAQTAYQSFKRKNSKQIKQSLKQRGEPHDLPGLTKAISKSWKSLSEEDREEYESEAAKDRFRFMSESHKRDVAVTLRKEQLRKQRDEIIITEGNGHSTRRARRKELKKAAKAEKKPKKKKKIKQIEDSDEDEFKSDGESSSSDNEYGSDESGSSSSSDSDDSNRQSKKKRKAPVVSAAVKARRENAKKERDVKEKYIAGRQQNLRNERAAQAQKRLDFLLKQSDIFRHFGKVKEDKTKFYGNRGTASTAESGVLDSPDKGTNRREAASANGVADVEAEELEEADESNATYLTTQPTTLGFGKMRQYQIEGLNWMIRLQENGVNGILADEMGLGKTLQSISILVYMLEYMNMNGPHLIVVPKSTLSNWMAELKRWAPTLNAIKFHGNKQEREAIATEILQPGQRDEHRTWNVAVTTYEVCNMDKNVLNKFAWSYLIIDEAHR
jgi:SWI/SNF-related matrix-associated actin-dependent regulator of chromatin subfamily A member 5